MRNRFVFLNILVKILFVFLLFAFIYLPSNGQTPSSLRVDLLQDPQQAYDHGVKIPATLKQALSDSSLQFCRINSRHPAFSWVVAQEAQSAYQILVSTRQDLLLDDHADVWNSGRQTSRNSIGVLYKGAALQPSTVYYWKVRTWGRDGKTSRYSAVQTFCTGDKLEDFALPSFVLIKTLQQPVKLSRPDNHHTLYDFGKDGFSQPRLSVNALNNGDTLLLQLGEAVTPAGHINHTPPGSVRYRLIKVPLQQGQHSYEPVIPSDKRNTAAHAIRMPDKTGEVLPFRYAETADAEQFSIDSVSRFLVTSRFDDAAATFTSSDTQLNKIWDFCKYTIKATSFSGYYVDGDRERIPYEADALIDQLSHYSSDAEFTLAERTLDYLIGHPTWPTEWSLQDILIAWNDYLYSGDLRLVRKLYPELKAKLLSDLAREDGLISTRTGKQTPEFLQSIHYYTPPKGDPGLKDIVDWPQSNVGGQPSGIMGESDGFVFRDYNSVVNAYYYAGLGIMAKLAAALGENSDASHYRTEAARVHTAFQHVFIDGQTNLVLDGEGTAHSSLHANFFALAFGLVPAEKTAAVVSFIHSRGMACSVYGAQFLLDALARVSDSDYALELLTSKSKRSWFNMLDEGATMTMEAWGQEYKPNQDWGHAWGTAPANYIVRHLAGIQPATPGFGEIEVKPAPGSVQSIKLVYRTIRGTIEESFENKTDHFSLRVVLPGNTSGHLYLPARSGKTIVKMDGRIIRAMAEAGYYRIDGVSPGEHNFGVYPATAQ